MRIVLLTFLFLLCSCSDKSGNSSWLSAELTEPKLDFANTDNLLEHYNRGQYLVNSVGACGFCHAKDLGGRAAPNITSDKLAGIGNWTLEEFVKVLKGGENHQGKSISAKTHKGLSWISDRDARAIGIYLLTTPAVSRIKGFKREEMLEKINIFDGSDNVPGYVIAPKENANASYGRYLALNVASCSSCHGADSEKMLSGVEDFTPSLRKVGTKWRKEQIVDFLTTGKTAKGKQVSAASCPWGYYRHATTLDKQAIALFLKAIS